MTNKSKVKIKKQCVPNQKLDERCLRRRQQASPRNMGPPWPSGLYPSRHPSAICTGRTWSACRPMPVHSGPPTLPVRVADHQIIATTRALRGALLNQGSRPAWEKSLRRPKKLPWSSKRPSPLSSFTYTHRCYHPASSQEETRTCLNGVRRHWP